MYHIFKHNAPGVYKKIQSWVAFEQERLLCWAPVCLGLGIALFFNSDFSLNWTLAGVIAAVLLILIYLFKSYGVFKQTGIALLLILAGFCLIQGRTERLSTPLITQELGPIIIEGELLDLEARPGDYRLTIGVTQNSLGIPLHKVRLSHRIKKGFDPNAWYPHDHLRIKGMLMPPRRAAFPGGYEFRRKAYFDGISAVGYTLKLPEKLERFEQKGYGERALQMINGWRYGLTHYLREVLPKPAGPIAAALVTGDRSGIPDTIREDFANAGIAHILAISGLHLSIVAGLVFLCIRGLMALIPPLALRMDIKKIAALFAIAATFMYMLISGSSTPAQRSFMMTSLIMVGILIDRNTVTLRNVALAAMAVLILFPEALISPSFQLSFSAVIALVSGFEWMRPRLQAWHQREKGMIGRLFFYFCGLLLSSFFATIATIPFTIYTFHRFSMVALISNLVAIPLVSFGLMPLLVLFVMFQKLLSTFGFGDLLVGPLTWSLDMLIQIATVSAAWPLAKIHVPLMSPILLGTFTLSMLWLALWRSPFRHLAWPPLCIATVLLLNTPRPDVFISESGRLIAALDDDGQGYISTKQSDRFAAKMWREALGVGELSKMAGPLKIHGDEFRFEQHGQGIQIVRNDQVLTQIDYPMIHTKGGCFLWLSDPLRFSFAGCKRTNQPWSD